MDTFKKAIYEQNKQFLEYIMDDFLSADSDDKENKILEIIKFKLELSFFTL